MTAPSLTHMEKANAIQDEWDAGREKLVPIIARALAAEHDAALEQAAAICESNAGNAGADGVSFADAIRAMKEGK